VRCKRGEVFWCNIDNSIGSEQDGTRPVVIIQNDIGNKFSTTTIVALGTSKCKKVNLPTHFFVSKENVEFMVMAEQVRTVSKRRLSNKIGELDNYELKKLNKALNISLDLIEKEGVHSI